MVGDRATMRSCTGLGGLTVGRPVVNKKPRKALLLGMVGTRGVQLPNLWRVLRLVQLVVGCYTYAEAASAHRYGEVLKAQHIALSVFCGRNLRMPGRASQCELSLAVIGGCAAIIRHLMLKRRIKSAP